ncbi:hypothetical protein G6L37_04605 [Agrobacterium rubi]|nr:hypothetical protein [Agrobacterium rubi]NTF24634.1 hypothetical protein [Agrobacterium rubi]
MTEARKLYAKIVADLEQAVILQEGTKKRLSAARLAEDTARADLDELARVLLPKAAETSARFSRYAQAVGQAEVNVASSLKEVEDTERQEHDLTQAWSAANREFGERAETMRREMIASHEYRDAVNALAVAETRSMGNELLLRQAEQKLARQTELAKQNPLHAILLKGSDNAPKGHFVLSMWNAAGDRLRQTEWYRRLDADRRQTLATLLDKQRIKSVAEATATQHRRSIEQRKLELEADLAPQRADVATKNRLAAAATRDATAAKERLKRAQQGLRSAKSFETSETKADLKAFVALMTRASEDLSALATLRGLFTEMRDVTGMERSLKQVERISADLRDLRIQSDSLALELETATAAVEELDRVKRKMKRSGMSSSSRKVENVDAFMAGDGNIDFDLSTVAMLAVVADSVSDTSPSSSSDWSSSSSSYDSSM